MALENIYFDLSQSYNHNDCPKEGSREASHRIWGGIWIRIQIHSQPLKYPSLLERSLVFGAAALLWVTSASENANSSSTKPSSEWEPAMLPTGRSRVWIRVLQHISLRGGSFGFKPPPPTGHYFQPLKCFLSLDTSGKSHRKETGPEELLFSCHSGSTAQNAYPPRQPRYPSLKAGEPWQTDKPTWEQEVWTLDVFY